MKLGPVVRFTKKMTLYKCGHVSSPNYGETAVCPLGRKSVFCYRTPDFVNGPFVALEKAVDLAPSDRFFDFSFPSYGHFREGDPPTQQKVLPHLTVGH